MPITLVRYTVARGPRETRVLNSAIPGFVVIALLVCCAGFALFGLIGEVSASPDPSFHVQSATISGVDASTESPRIYVDTPEGPRFFRSHDRFQMSEHLILWVSADSFEAFRAHPGLYAHWPYLVSGLAIVAFLPAAMLQLLIVDRARRQDSRDRETYALAAQHPT